VSSPLTPQQCDDIDTRANAATPGPWTVELEQCDCSDGLCGHGTYVSAVYANGERRTDFTDFPDADWQFTIHARTDVAALLATVRHLTKRVAELEAYAYGCDAEGCTIPHSSWCEVAKKTAAQNDGCTCGQPWIGHPQPHAMHCWTVNPPRAEVQEMRKKVAEVIAGRDSAAIELREAARKAITKAEAERDATRTKTLAIEADEIVAHCPDHGTKDRVWMTCHCPVADDLRRRAAAPSSV
jgi:hypothetical protein